MPTSRAWGRIQRGWSHQRPLSCRSAVKSTGDVVYEELAKCERDLKNANKELEALRKTEAALRTELQTTQQELINLRKAHR